MPVSPNPLLEGGAPPPTWTAPGTGSQPFVDAPGVAAAPGATSPPGPAATVPDVQNNQGLPDPWTVYAIDGNYFLVWNAPVGDGQNVPVGWEITTAEFFQQFSVPLAQHVTHTMTMAEYTAAGGVDAGGFDDINLGAEFWNDPLEGWLDALEENEIVAPWLEDPEVAALAASAYVEGTSLSQALMAGTEWWQHHNAAQRAWLLLYSSDPATAHQQIADNQLLAEDLLQAAGINNADQIMLDINGRQVTLANWLANQVTIGNRSQTWVEHQINFLADPRMHNRLDSSITAALGGALADVNGTRSFELRVEELFRTWLGPMYGAPSERQIRTWASRLRNDPDAETRLTDYLAGQRVALFPEYTDRSLTYEDIAGPWRNLGWQTWGQDLDETSSFFTDLVRANDATEATKMLRREGLARGVDKVAQDLVTTFGNSFGGPIVRAQ